MLSDRTRNVSEVAQDARKIRYLLKGCQFFIFSFKPQLQWWSAAFAGALNDAQCFLEKMTAKTHQRLRAAKHGICRFQSLPISMESNAHGFTVTNVVLEHKAIVKF